MIVEIVTKDRPELIPPLIKRLNYAEKIIVVYTTDKPERVDDMLKASKNQVEIVINNFDNKTVSYRYVWDMLHREDGLFLDDNVWFKSEHVQQIQEQLNNHREASMISGWLKMGDYSNTSLMETSKPWKFFIVNHEIKDKIKPDIFLPKGMYDDKQLGIDSWLLGYPVYKDLSIPLSRKNVGRPSGIIGKDDRVRGKTGLTLYKEVGWDYFVKKYPFTYLTKEKAVVVGLERLKELASTKNFFIDDIKQRIKECNEAPYDYKSHITEIYSN